MAGVQGLEPWAHGFGDRCSTNCSTPLNSTALLFYHTILHLSIIFSKLILIFKFSCYISPIYRAFPNSLLYFPGEIPLFTVNTLLNVRIEPNPELNAASVTVISPFFNNSHA